MRARGDKHGGLSSLRGGANLIRHVGGGATLDHIPEWLKLRHS